MFPDLSIIVGNESSQITLYFESLPATYKLCDLGKVGFFLPKLLFFIKRAKSRIYITRIKFNIVWRLLGMVLGTQYITESILISVSWTLEAEFMYHDAETLLPKLKICEIHQNFSFLISWNFHLSYSEYFIKFSGNIVKHPSLVNR